LYFVTPVPYNGKKVGKKALKFSPMYGYIPQTALVATLDTFDFLHLISPTFRRYFGNRWKIGCQNA
jgi:hypothetical protein